LSIEIFEGSGFERSGFEGSGFEGSGFEKSDFEESGFEGESGYSIFDLVLELRLLPDFSRHR
jgi:hypothetical protein